MTGAVDTSGPGVKNSVGYWLGRYYAVKVWNRGNRAMQAHWKHVGYRSWGDAQNTEYGEIAPKYLERDLFRVHSTRLKPSFWRVPEKLRLEC